VIAALSAAAGQLLAAAVLLGALGLGVAALLQARADRHDARRPRSVSPLPCPFCRAPGADHADWCSHHPVRFDTRPPQQRRPA